MVEGTSNRCGFGLFDLDFKILFFCFSEDQLNLRYAMNLDFKSMASHGLFLIPFSQNIWF